jgi:septum formation protein
VKERADKIVSLSALTLPTRSCAWCSPSSSTAPGRSSRATPITANDARRARGRSSCPASTARPTCGAPFLAAFAGHQPVRGIDYPNRPLGIAQCLLPPCGAAGLPDAARVVVAESFSGLVAARWASMDPHVEALVLCGAFARNPVTWATPSAASLPSMVRFGAAFLTTAPLQPRSPAPAMVEGLSQCCAALDDAVIGERLRLIAARTLRPQLRPARCPIVLCSSRTTSSGSRARGQLEDGLSQCARGAVARAAFRHRDEPAECAEAIGRACDRPNDRASSGVMIYLASRSPRRASCSPQIGVKFEPLLSARGRAGRRHRRGGAAGEQPDDYVRRVTQSEGEAAWQRVVMRRGLQRKPVLAADTTVALAGEILGKPADRADAERMLKTALRHAASRAHRGRRAFESRFEIAVSESLVTFDALDAERIAAYVASGEPFDKAGAYAIQGRAARLRRAARGSYTGVMGLPLFETANLSAKFGIHVP